MKASFLYPKKLGKKIAAAKTSHKNSSKSSRQSIELEGWTKLYVSSTGSIARICKYDHSIIPSNMVNVEDNACKVYAGSKAVPLYDKAVSSISYSRAVEHI